MIGKVCPAARLAAAEILGACRWGGMVEFQRLSDLGEEYRTLENGDGALNLHWHPGASGRKSEFRDWRKYAEHLAYKSERIATLRLPSQDAAPLFYR